MATLSDSAVANENPMTVVRYKAHSLCCDSAGLPICAAGRAQKLQPYAAQRHMGIRVPSVPDSAALHLAPLGYE